jgi:hypothetical protein
VDRTDAIKQSTERGSTLLVVAASLVLVGVVGSAAWAQEAKGWVEFGVDSTDLEADSAVGQPTNLELLTYRQRYNLDLRWRLFPNLRMSIGGLFEQDDTKDAGSGSLSDTTQKRWRPRFNLAFGNRLYSANLGFYRIEDSIKTETVSSKNIQDLYSAAFGWRPESYPSWRLRLQRTDNYDSRRQSRNTRDDLIDLRSDYVAFEKLEIYYRTSRSEFEDKLTGNGSLSDSHAGELSYSDSFLNNRLLFSTEYNINYRSSEITSSGEGEFVTPVDADAGLSALSDTPTDVALDDNPALIDEDRTASAGINLGLQPVGGNEEPRNMGLDFGAPVTVDTLRVWVDRDLPPGISNAFMWDVYTSSDNQAWVWRDTIAPADFGPLETRFEIRFPDITERYMKVVTRPLDRTVPGADRFPNIFVTELEAFQRTPASEAPSKSSLTTHRFASDLRAKLMENHAFYYEFSYFWRDAGDRPSTWALTNGLSFSERLSPVYSVSARVAREDALDRGEESTTHAYSASLRASALPTVQHSVVVSGRTTDDEGGSTEAKSVYLYNTVRFYRGVRMDVGAGKAATERADGVRTDSTTVNATATLVPHDTVTVNLLYQQKDDEQSGAGLTSNRQTDLSSSQISVAYTPFAAVYLFGSYRRESADDVPPRTLTNYNVSWTPFPSGNLQLTFRYDESYRSEFNSESRIFSPRARWNITNAWWAEVAYQRSSVESDIDERDAELWGAGMRIQF